jgi:hypothetical protein
MRNLIGLYTRPKMRRNPNSWLTIFMLRRGRAVPTYYAAMDVGELPRWESLR